MSPIRRTVLAPTPTAAPVTSDPGLPASTAMTIDPASHLGRYQLTYYWVADESAYSAQAEVALHDMKCRVITRVSRKFRKALRMEGTGRLRDGRLVNVAGKCACGYCFTVVDPEDHPDGLGVKQRSLKPFRSVAAGRHIAIGTRLYVPELDGLTIPGSGDVHDGCVVADDRGGNISGEQLDLFTGRKAIYLAFMRRHRLEAVSVYGGGERCSEPTGPGVARRGQG